MSHRENGAWFLLGPSNPTLDDDSRGDQGKVCSHRFLAVPSAQVMRSEGLRLLQTFPAPANPAVPVGESMLTIFHFAQHLHGFFSWTRAHGKDFRGGGSLILYQ